ncbi:MAG: Pyruvate ferredoxin oxidoreductase gamma subunit [Parcubacteria group bacterium GW2011_GWC2_39_14]|nr:MAG: Pyruvate ferredoxin oxidoreductase gamma subunit [Parcubacteria group bacterium GW2011_GWC2_39_14]KKR54749.1 MAG: Pyruvate ferredoxin oxidoreductase gamma subunit [Parcubacteria group bacterium GW2011_GWA2_40_23]
MGKIVQVRFHGRGGQGSVTAAELFAVAAFYDGKYAQAFPSFGVERRGAPVQAFLRISDSEIRLREQITKPDYLIVQDPTLLGENSDVLEGTEKTLGILINTDKPTWPSIKNSVCIPATKIALEKIGKPFINTAILGAFAAMTGLASLDSLRRAVNERFPEALAKLNIAALETAYNFIKNR